MRRRANAACLVVALVLASSVAREARAQKGDFGVGLILGAPSGLSVELRLANSLALDLAVGVSPYAYSYVGHRFQDFYAHMDLLVMLGNLARPGSKVRVPPYMGLGVFVVNRYDRFYVYRSSTYFSNAWDLGVRVPLGLAIDFKRAPLQLFVEAAALIVLANYNHAYGYSVGVGAAAGFRFFF